METIKKAKEILKQSKKKNLSMLYLIDDDLYHTVEVFDDSVMVRRKNDRKSVYVYSPSEQSFRDNILPNIKKEDKSFSSVEKWMVEILKENNEIERINYGQKLVLPDNIKLHPPKTKTRPLTVEDAPKVNKYWEYSGENSLEYIKDIITNKLCEGIDRNNKIVAWALTHQDGSLGMMYVMEEWRGNGFAIDITHSMSMKIRESGRIPFLHVVENNHKSFSLTAKMGFETVNHIVWLTLK